MKAVLRFGALAMSVALTAGGAGEAAQPAKKSAPAAESRKGKSRQEPAKKEKAKEKPASAPEEASRKGPARIGPARVGPASMDNTPRIADAQKDGLADRKRDEA
ncbi:MAG TPA: hypothetical protein VGB96_13035, partial [Archangium sp.]